MEWRDQVVMLLGKAFMPLATLPASIALAVAVLTGCTTPQTSSNTTPETQDVTGILERIRQDVGNYEYIADQWRGTIKPKIADPAIPPAPFTSVCPIINYDFDITKIELSLQVTAENTASGDVGLKVPVGGATLGPDINGSRAQTQTKTIVFDRIPTDDPSQLVKFHDGPDYQNLTVHHKAFLSSQQQTSPGATRVFPITDTIIGLRKSLLAAAGKYPCFDIDLDKSTGDSIKLDFEVDKSIDPTLGFDFLIVTAKVDNKIESKLDNTLTITIAPHSTAASLRKLAKK
jgi:hypothetical protein